MPTKPAPKRSTTRAAAYLRISKDTAGEGLGVERQRQICRRVAKDRGWVIAEEYADNDISAFGTKRRPEWERLRSDVRAGLVDVVMAVDQDRLTRRLSELANVLDEFATLGVPIVTASGEVDTTSADGRLRAHILGAVAENESRKKSERLKREREQAAHRGDTHGGKRPFGYTKGGREVDKAEAKLVREAARRLLAGESSRAIASDWNSRAIPTSVGGVWRTSSIRSMMAGPRLAGLRVYKGEVVGDAMWPAIIDRDTHEKLVAHLNDPRHPKRGRPPANFLTGMVRCGVCDGPLMYGRRPDGTRRLLCSPGPGTNACGRVSVVAEPLESHCTKALLKAIADRKFTPTKSEPDTLTADVVALERDLESLADDWGNGRISRREWFAAKAPLEARLAKATTAMRRASDTSALAVFDGCTDVARVWNKLDLEVRRAVLAAMVDHFVVNRAEVSGRRYFDKDRVDPKWRS